MAMTIDSIEAWIAPDGSIAIPQSPGLGVEVDWETVEAHGTKVP